jgi:uncharacterized protein YjcR
MPAPKGNRYALGNKGGRPSKFRPDTIERDRKYVDDTTGFPAVEGLARQLNVSTDTICNWGRENEEFFGIVVRVRTIPVIK